MQQLLMIEDDARLAGMVVDYLGQNGFAVAHAPDAQSGLARLQSADVDLVILDLMLPDMDGLQVCQRIRALPGSKAQVPVLMLTAKGDPMDRIIGLEMGADDYLPKPFAFSELLARLRLLIARAAPGPTGGTPETQLRCADLEMNLLSRKVTRGGKRIDLQPREFRLLEYLLRHQDQGVTRTMMLEGVWEYHFDPGTNIVDVVINHLRKKIDAEGAPMLHTVRGAGYMIKPAE